MDKIVTLMQSSFIPGRHITDNIIVTQEVMHSIRRMRGKDGYMAVKIDLGKAYDRLNWDFIFYILQDIGVPIRLFAVIMKCFTSTKMHISWNEEF